MFTGGNAAQFEVTEYNETEQTTLRLLTIVAVSSAEPVLNFGDVFSTHSQSATTKMTFRGSSGRNGRSSAGGRRLATSLRVAVHHVAAASSAAAAAASMTTNTVHCNTRFTAPGVN